MPSLIWTPQTLDDIKRIYQFLGIKNRDAAKRAVSIIRESMNVLYHYNINKQQAVILVVKHQKEIAYSK
ncbi:MAG: type II toxin-antitoxin system RelE/ParE family toxin [Colwellia sp.]